MALTDYPKAAVENAKKALKLREEEGTKCGTPVGWRSAKIIASRGDVEARLPRIYSFLSRAKVYDQGRFKDEDGKQICGSIMYAAWGGDEMHRWAKRTLENMEEEKSVKRHIKNIEETATEIIITYGKSEPEEASKHYEEDEKKTVGEGRAEPGELKAGDFVSWNSSGGRSQGVIVRVEDNGQVEADSGFKVNGSKEDPAALISVYEYSSEEEAFVERKPPLKVAHLFSTLKKVDGAEVRSLNELVAKRSYDVEYKAVEGSRTVEGYASVFNSMSEDLGGFREIILPGAFKNVLNDDVRALYNHDPNYLLARTASGTLEIREDEKGLYYRFEMPDTSYGNDMLELFRRGDLSQSSFGFIIDKDRWEFKDGQHLRYIESVSSLLDVSPVVYPAYSSSKSGLRSQEAPEAEKATEDVKEVEELNFNLHNALIKLAKNEC